MFSLTESAVGGSAIVFKSLGEHYPIEEIVFRLPSARLPSNEFLEVTSTVDELERDNECSVSLPGPPGVMSTCGKSDSLDDIDSSCANLVVSFVGGFVRSMLVVCV